MSRDEISNSFGFSNIIPEEKQSKVESLFSKVSSKYDIMNDVMSFGLHRKWKDYFVSILSPSADKKYLDLAGGTGDIALRIADKCGSGRHITLIDLTLDMILAGIQKQHPFNHEIKRICASAEQIPCKDNLYDGVTMSYGLRNVTHINKVLEEAFRVLNSGGKFMCLEFCMPSELAFKKIYDLYSFKVLPKMGKLISGDADSYRYLAESIRRFPSPDHLEDKMKKAGFQNTSYRLLSGGITAIHVGYKI